MFARVARVLTIAGCGTSTQPAMPSPDAPSECFSAPTPIEGVNSGGNEFSPWMSNDRLELVFGRLPVGEESQLFHATRTSPDVAFDEPQALTELNTGKHDGEPAVSEDGLTIWFGSDRDGLLRVYEAGRLSRDQPFGVPVMLAELSHAASEDGFPDVSADQLTIVFASNREDTGFYDLFRAERTNPSEAFGAPVREVGLASPRYDCCSTHEPEADRVLFASDGFNDAGKIEIMSSSRVDGTWSAPEVFVPLASDRDDWDPQWMSDGSGILLASNRDGGMGGTDLYISTVLCPR